jgi:hypothetical protein
MVNIEFEKLYTFGIGFRKEIIGDHYGIIILKTSIENEIKRNENALKKSKLKSTKLRKMEYREILEEILKEIKRKENEIWEVNINEEI